MTNASKEKGTRAELNVRDVLRELTKLPWERTPSSGALSHYKGDIILPPSSGAISKFAIEVKHYADDLLTSNVITGKPEFFNLWAQTVRQAGQMNAQPMMIFKKDRGKLLVAVPEEFLRKDVPYIILENIERAPSGRIVIQDLVRWGANLPKEFFAHMVVK